MAEVILSLESWSLPFFSVFFLFVEGLLGSSAALLFEENGRKKAKKEEEEEVFVVQSITSSVVSMPSERPRQVLQFYY